MKFMEAGHPVGSDGALRMSMEEQGLRKEHEDNASGHTGYVPTGPMDTGDFQRFSTPSFSGPNKETQSYSARPQPADSRRNYRKESDIFGTSNQRPVPTKGTRYGMKIDHDARIVQPETPFGFQSPRKVESSSSRSARDNANEERFAAGRRTRNARETGGNPLTGEGYGDIDTTHSQRRQFHRSSISSPLW